MTSGAAGRRKVAILDLRRREQDFIGDGFLEGLAADLGGRGHSVVLARGVLPPGGDQRAEADARLAAVVADGDFDVVTLARGWDEAALRVLRGAMRPGASLVRVSPPGRTPTPAAFDADLDPAGLVARLEADPGRKAEGAGPAGAPGVRELPLWGAADARPTRLTLAGPRRGCPWLADARRNPHFADLDLDPDRVRVRGCTFCTDNTGTWSPAPDDEVLAAWLAGLRAGRARHPDVHEYLLIDERPHPLLPAFFEAVAAEPGLAPLELLIKSRVADVLAFADTAFAQAAAIAARSGSTLHLYLVGFENFDPFHLELFNKGHTVQDNVAALQRLRDLERRFPGAFEFRRHRAHGFLLFTPWTEPQHLLRNAIAMREVGFEDVRAGALRTRLRLNPDTPLYLRARRDGLLSDTFDEGLVDRAAEQGYNPSAPWRFRDRRTATICGMTARLAEVEPGWRECDLLETATRFLLRWPGLCDVPGDAHLPLQGFLRSFVVGDTAALCDAGGAAMTAFDPELEGVAAGLRTACLKESLRSAGADGLIRAYRAMGFDATVVSRHGLDASMSHHVEGDAFVSIAVARDAEALATFVAAHRAGAAGEPGAVEAAGALLGYPPCCRAAFAAAGDVADNDANERRPFLAAPAAPLHPLLNRLGRVRLLSHHLCRPDCAASIALGDALIGVARRVAAVGVDGFVATLQHPVLYLDHLRRAELAGRWDGGRFQVERFSTLGDAERRGVPTTNVRWIELESSGARIGAPDGTFQAVPSAGAILAVPGGKSVAVAGGQGGQSKIEGQTPDFQGKNEGGSREESGKSGVCPQISHADLEAFQRLWLGGRKLPAPLPAGWRIATLGPGDTDDSIELELARETGEPVRLFVSPTRPDAARYARTRFLDVGYRPAPADISPDALVSLLESARALLESNERSLKREALSEVFPGAL